MRNFGLVAVLAGSVALAGCGEREVILEGERLDPRAVLTEGETAPAEAPAAKALSLPAAQSNAEWTHRGGNVRHALGHVALGQGLNRVFSANIGQGETRKNRIGADPIVAGGRIYTMDARALVTATAPNGGTLWQADLTPASDSADDASGGGLAFAEGRVYATTGFGEIVALDAATGGILWRQKLDAGIGGAPAVAGGTVYVAARDSSAWAVEAATGRVKWQLTGTPASAGVTGVSAPAVGDAVVIYPFPSGELAAVSTETGLDVWRGQVGGARVGRAFAKVADVTGDPVIVNGVVYAGSSAGKLVALDEATGQRLWTAEEGAASPVQVAGGSVFLISDESQLVRLDAATGQVIWAVDLPYYVKDREKRRRDIYAHFGPVLAGGKLMVASSDGLLRAFDPVSGGLVGSTDLPGGAASAPVVAGGTLYVVGRNGQLHAFR